MKTPVIVHNRFTRWWFGLIDFKATAFYPFIFLRDEPSEKTESLIRHELIHFEQTCATCHERAGGEKELWLIGFYILYLYYYLRNRIRGHAHKKTYVLIPFEYEAYLYEADQNYLKTRRPFAWKNYTSL